MSQNPIVLVRVSGGIAYITNSTPFPVVLFDEDAPDDYETRDQFKAELHAFDTLVRLAASPKMEVGPTDPSIHETDCGPIGVMLTQLREKAIAEIKAKYESIPLMATHTEANIATTSGYARLSSSGHDSVMIREDGGFDSIIVSKDGFGAIGISDVSIIDLFEIASQVKLMK